jgi:DNA-binding transcriptional LysR family regulator
VLLGRPSISDDNDLVTERLCDEPLRVVAGNRSSWAKRKQLDIAELVDVPWILASTDNVARAIVEEAFTKRRLSPPQPRITTYSMHLRMQLLATGRYLTVMGDMAVRANADRWGLRALPLDLGRRLPVAAIMLAGRTPTPAVGVFMASVREVIKGKRR